MTLSGAAAAGWVGDDLAPVLAAAGASDQVSVIAVLSERPPVVELEHRLYRAGWSAPRRHAHIVRELQSAAWRTQERIMARLHELDLVGRVEGVRPYWIVNAVAFTAAPEVIYELAALPEVAEVYEDSPIILDAPTLRAAAPAHNNSTHEWGLDMIGAPALWARGITGRGVVVCNIDTGVDNTHPALAEKWRGRDGSDWRHHWLDPSWGSDDPFDQESHGTHTMGIICGSVPGDTVGVAPDAEWIAALAITGVGDFVGKALGALEWAADPDGDPETADNPDVISNSWSDLQLRCKTTFYEAIDNCEAVGSTVIFSAGNGGPKGESITSPKNRATTPVNIFATGALTAAEVITNYSSRGPSHCDHVSIKPAAVAPGDAIRSSIPPDLGAPYALMSGTSMAAPHIAGAVALLKQANPNLDPETIKLILQETARDLGAAGPDNTYGWGVIDLETAYQAAVAGMGLLAGQITDAASGAPLAARVAVADWPHTTHSDDTGSFALWLPAGSEYTVEVAAFGHDGASFSGHITARDTTFWSPALSATPAGALQGVVLGPDGEPLVGAQVAVLETPIEPVLTDAAGAYWIAPVPADSSYALQSTRCGYLPVGGDALVEAEQASSVDFLFAGPLADDVESGENGWTHTSIYPGFGDQWHLSTKHNRTPGGRFAWKLGSTGRGNYADTQDAVLQTHCFDISAASQLRFWHRMEVETKDDTTAYDGGLVEVSVDGGPFEVITPEAGYPYQAHGGFRSTLAPGTPCFSGIFDWKPEVFDLGDRSGETLFRFHFASDTSVGREGWFIDDLWVNPPGRNLLLTLDGIPLSVPVGGTATWEATLENGEDVDLLVDAWIEVSGLGPVKQIPLARGVLLPARARVTQPIELAIPIPTPPNTYRIDTVVGVLPLEDWVREGFDLAVVPVE
jgi:hypothetical protein